MARKARGTFMPASTTSLGAARARRDVPRRLRPHRLLQTAGTNDQQARLEMPRVLPDDDALPPARRSGGRRTSARHAATERPYAQTFNLRWGRSGHLKGDRYGAEQVETDGHISSRASATSREIRSKLACAHIRPTGRGAATADAAGYDDGFAFVTDDFLLANFRRGPHESDNGCCAIRRGARNGEYPRFR